MKYRVSFYYNSKTDSYPVREFLDGLSVKHRAKIAKYIDFLAEHQGYLDEPYSKHIRGKIRELRIDFGKDRYRIMYFTFVGQNIVLLHSFLKRSKKIPARELEITEKRYLMVLSEKELYE